MAITRSQLVKELEPGLNALFGLEYKRYENEHEEIFAIETSDRAFEEEVMEPQDLDRARNERGSHFDIRLRHAPPGRRRLMEALPQRIRASSRWTIDVADADRQVLAEHYRPEVTRLEELVGRRMPWRL